MYTVESLKEQFQTYHDKCLKDPHMRDETKPLFNEDGSFNPKNWNSNQADIRTKLFNFVMVSGCSISTTNDQFRTTEEMEEEYIPTVNLYAFYQYDNDQWYIMINIISEEVDRYDNYVVSWYKDRGCTQMITKNGSPINMEEYVELLNELESLGYFEKEYWKH